MVGGGEQTDLVPGEIERQVAWPVVRQLAPPSSCSGRHPLAQHVWLAFQNNSRQLWPPHSHPHSNQLVCSSLRIRVHLSEHHRGPSRPMPQPQANSSWSWTGARPTEALFPAPAQPLLRVSLIPRISGFPPVPQTVLPRLTEVTPDRDIPITKGVMSLHLPSPCAGSGVTSAR